MSVYRLHHLHDKPPLHLFPNVGCGNDFESVSRQQICTQKFFRFRQNFVDLERFFAVHAKRSGQSLSEDKKNDKMIYYHVDE